MPLHTCGNERTAGKNPFSLCTTRALDRELSLSGSLHAEPSPWPSNWIFKRVLYHCFESFKNKSEVGKLADLDSLIEDKGESFAQVHFEVVADLT